MIFLVCNCSYIWLPTWLGSPRGTPQWPVHVTTREMMSVKKIFTTMLMIFKDYHMISGVWHVARRSGSPAVAGHIYTVGRLKTHLWVREFWPRIYSLSQALDW